MRWQKRAPQELSQHTRLAPHRTLCLLAASLVFAARGAAKTVYLDDEAFDAIRARHVRIYTYKLPACSFDHFDAAEIDGSVNRRGVVFHQGRPPLLPIHRKLVHGRYATDDPHNATHFYIPAPFFLWDDSWKWDKEVCDAAKQYIIFSDHDERPLGGEDAAPCEIEVNADAEPEGLSFGLWLRSWQEGGTLVQSTGWLLQTRTSRPELALNVGLKDGCPVMSVGSDLQIAPACDASIWADGMWHHVGGTLTNKLVAQLNLDFVPLGAPTELTAPPALKEGPGLREGWYRGGLDVWGFVSSRAGFLHGCAQPAPDESSNSPCLRRVRAAVEAQPWLERRGGWDHIVLFGGVDYPRKFDPLHPSADYDFVLEQSWPAFKNFVLLHFGTRTERCLAHFSDPRSQLDGNKLSAPDCHRRVFQTITVPPLLKDEDFDCAKMAERAQVPRSHRVAYRGLAYVAMVERSAVASAVSEANLNQYQLSGAFRLEFTNWTHELLKYGVCRESFAFDGLCPWSQVGRARDEEFGKGRMLSMRKRALELWSQTELGLVLPGDGGYELRLYSMLDKVAIPVIVHHRGVAYPKIPFSALLPWHRFALFFDLGRVRHHLGLKGDLSDSWSDINPVGSAHQLLNQLALLDPKVLEKKRRALLRYAPALSWEDRLSCGGTRQRNALDFLAAELAQRLTRHLQTGASLIPWLDWSFKIPDHHLAMSEVTDITGTGCPLGFPFCEKHELGGNVCLAQWPGRPFACPIGCKESKGGPPLCRKPGGAPCDLPKTPEVPCGSTLSWRLPDDVLPYHNGIIRRPRVALITYSDRPELSALTRPSLERFCQEHPGRYDLIVEQEPLLDPEQFAAAWNKLAFMRRVLITRLYDAVLWIDDDILITEPTQDPIYEGLTKSIVKLWSDTYLYASKDTRFDKRVPFNTGILGLRNVRRSFKLIQDLFAIAREPQILDTQVIVPRNQGWWEQDAFAVWVERNGLDLVHLEEHRQIQSFVRSMKDRAWQPGDFAAHFTGIRNQEHRLSLMKSFVREQWLRNRGEIV